MTSIHSGDTSYLNEISAIWETVRETFRKKLSSETIELWFGDLCVIDYADAVITFATTSPWKHKVIHERFIDDMTAGFCELLGFDVTVKVLLKEEHKESIYTPEFLANAKQASAISFDSSDKTEEAVDNKPIVETPGAMPSYHFEYTFDNFIIGASNKFAHAACFAVADRPAMDYNPLFIYGQSGLGKTHLMYAVINKLKQKNPNIRIAYVKGDDFTNHLVDSLKRNAQQEFRDRYRKCDVLLIDDIQFIAGKESTQEEIFHTFNTLYEEHKQIIFTSDRPPRDIQPLEDRLRTRFEWGLIADIQPPDLELRVAIIKKKAEQVSVDLPDDVLIFLAENLRSNIRQIEGAIKKLGALAFLSGRELNMELAKDCISELLGGAEPVNVTVDKIFAAVQKKYDVKREDIVSTRRTKEIAWARHVTIYLIRSITEISFPNIGKMFNRDHSTVISSIEAVEKKRKNDTSFALELNELKKEISGQA